VVAIEESHLGGMLEEMDSFDFEKYRSALLQSLDQLREHDLEIVEMRFFEQRPFKEIAEFLEITESNAKVRTYRVLDKLKKLMLEKLPDDQ
jgi:RNA polymerase sigma-70 factor (ECF subfamily)